MSKLSVIVAAAVAGAVMLAASAASAAPGITTGLNKADIATESQIIQVQRRGVRPGVRPVGPPAGRVVRRGGRGIGGAGAAAIGLGVLGAAIAVGAAQSQPYYRECWIENRPVHDGWGNFMGYRRIRVCN